MISVVCFSKDRPMQLEAYLESLMHFGGISPESINVLIAEGAGISYDLTRARFPGVRWIAEQHFHQDLMPILENAANYVLFGCDDVVFKDYFDVNDCIRTLQQDAEVFGFSLRLGANLNFVPQLRESDGVLTWSWGAAKADYWDYPWEVSATVYRREAVLGLLRDRPDLSNPNRLEAYLAKQIANRETVVPPKLACFPRSCCMTITVNRVQDEFPNDFDASKGTAPDALYGEYVGGMRQDWPKLALQRNDSIHLGAESFHLVAEVQPPQQRYALATGNLSARSRQRWLTLKFWWWRIMTVGWEASRKVLPRPILNGLKTSIRKIR
jgi:hypothetical protein